MYNHHVVTHYRSLLAQANARRYLSGINKFQKKLIKELDNAFDAWAAE